MGDKWSVITGLLLDVGTEITVFPRETSARLLAILLHLHSVGKDKWSVITGQLLDVGTAITVSLKETFAHLPAMLLLILNVVKENFSAIMDRLLVAGMEMSAYRWNQSAHQHAIHPPQLVVLRARRPATWGQTLGAGWATIVYPRSLTVLLSVTTLLQCHVRKEK